MQDWHEDDNEDDDMGGGHDGDDDDADFTSLAILVFFSMKPGMNLFRNFGVSYIVQILHCRLKLR